mgnify:CR=1 FL=1
MEIDNKVENLLNGIYNLFELKFPSKNFNIKPIINELGYHMTYLGVYYDINFIDEKNMRFELNARCSKSIPNLEEKLNRMMISNKQLDETKYFLNHQININGDSINVNCTLNKVPTSEREINFLCDQLWELIIRNVFLGIHH